MMIGTQVLLTNFEKCIKIWSMLGAGLSNPKPTSRLFVVTLLSQATAPAPAGAVVFSMSIAFDQKPLAIIALHDLLFAQLPFDAIGHRDATSSADIPL